MPAASPPNISTYGGARYTSGTLPTSKGYTSQRADAATGLDSYGARYYDPAVGQFTSADDVLPGDGLDPWGLSRYAYVEGNPIARNDPSGHCWLVCAAIAAVATFAVVTVGDAIVQQATTGHVDWGQAATAGAVAGVVVGAAIALGPLGVAAVEGLAAEGTVAGAGAAVASTAGELLAADAAIVGAAGAAV